METLWDNFYNICKYGNKEEAEKMLQFLLEADRLNNELRQIELEIAQKSTPDRQGQKEL